MKKLLIIIILFPFFCQAQKLLFLQDNVKGQMDFVKKNRLEVYKLINQSQFVTNDQLDEEKLRKEVIRRFPNTSSSGYAVLDWEGKAMDALISQKDEGTFKMYIGEFVRALKIAKKLRPNVKWGFYALPYRQYWNINDTFRNKNYRLVEILKNQDFIEPSLYTFYPEAVSRKSNSEYIHKNISLALELGRKYNKPVYAFIWHRVHPSNKKYSEEQIPLSVFEEEIAQMLSSYNGYKISGLMWWHSENYSCLNRSKSRVYAKEYEDISDANSYQRAIFQRYFDSIKKYLDK
ncbi:MULTISPECIES: hypothetical protein [Sphingobacterium]|uniref:hypothetical protein n=1 Tax=Sphingobacterium TaxID=28453 RepID=UPI00257BD9B1|nr:MULTISPECIES: hypothetical protein [Sphingobacterium]